MKASYAFLGLFLYLAYVAYSTWDYTQSPESDYGLAKANLQTLEESYRSKEKQLKESQDFFRTLDAKRNELRALSEKLISMKSTLSESVDIPSFLRLVVTEAQRIGLQITSVVPLGQSRQTYFGEQPVEVQFSGVFIQLIAYLDRISQTSRIIRVQDISLRPITRGPRRPTDRYAEITGSFIVKTFYYITTRDDELGREGAK